MEMEDSPAPVVEASKLWNVVRVVVFMLKKGIAKSKKKINLNLLVKRGKITAAKAVTGSLMLHNHYAAFTCRSHDSNLSFISPTDYEFSCSNSPAFPYHSITNKRKLKPYKYDDVSTFNAVRKVVVDNLEVTNSPSVTLPGFGESPIGGKQLRITDSPFPLKDDDEDGDAQVDRAAEEFINKFYRALKLQKRMAAVDSPYNNFWDR